MPPRVAFPPFEYHAHPRRHLPLADHAKAAGIYVSHCVFSRQRQSQSRKSQRGTTET